MARNPIKTAKGTFTWILTLLMLLVACGFVLGVNLLMRKQALLEAEEKATLLLQHNLSIHSYLNQVQKPQLLELLKDQIAQGYFDPSWMSSTFAVRNIDANYRHLAREQYYYKEAAINARSPLNEADPFEKEFLLRLNQDPKLQIRSGTREVNGEPFFEVLSRGETLEPGCMRCHSTPQEAPKGLVDYYGPDRSFGRHLGEVVSVVSIRIPLQTAYRTNNQASLVLSLGFLLVLGVVFLLQRRLAQEHLVRPLKRLQDQVEVLTQNPGTKGQQLLLEAGEEFGGLVGGLNQLLSRADHYKAKLEDSNFSLYRQMEELDQVHKEMERINRRFLELVGNVPGVVFQLESGLDNQIQPIFVSEKVRDFYGVDPQEVRQNFFALWAFVDLADQVEMEKQIQGVFEGAEGFTCEHLVEVPGADKRWFKWVVHVTGEAFGIRTWNGLVVEVTDQKLQAARLEEAHSQAEKANQAKSGYLATLSHEVRTPINAILGYGALLEPQLAEGPLKNYLEAMLSAAKSLLEIINDILDFSKMEAGKLQLHEEPVRPAELVEQAVTGLRLLAQNKGLLCQVELDGLADQCYLLDRVRLTQVINNLLSNALKFTDQGQVTLRLKGREVGPLRVELTLEVEDTGIGISPEELGRIFEPFEHHEEAGRFFEGTGLGLPITQRLVDLMGGTLEVRSQLGQGSFFVVRLFATPCLESSSPKEEARPVQFAPALVLVVDDMEINRLLLVQLLKQAGLQAFEAVDGQEALRRAQEINPQLILMDLKMRQMGGIEATRRLKESPGTAAIPVLALSAATLEGEEAQRFDGVLTKPIEPQELYRELSRFLARR